MLGTFSNAGWDYPSIGVDGSGRIIIGAVSFITCGQTTCPNGYYSVVSTDSTNFSAPSFIAKPAGGAGAQSRVVATNNVFQAFVPTLNTDNVPTQVNRWQSSNGTSWTGPNLLANFTAPAAHPPVGATQIYYAPLLTAQGYTNGLWTVAFQINNGGFNNAYLCTSDRGCGLVNAAGTDQFLVGTSVSGDSAYWVSYYVYTSAPRTLPLKTQAFYFPHGQSGIGATTNTGIDPTKWLPTNTRCFVSGQSENCYAAGDFHTVGSNPFASATTPFVKQSTTHLTDLFQSFTQNPPSEPNVPNFAPNTIWFPVGADLTSIGVTAAPGTLAALPPGETRGVPEQ